MRQATEDEFTAYVSLRRVELVRTAVLLTGGDRALAEDLVQTTLTKVYLAWPRLRTAGPDGQGPHPYARRVLANALADEHRRPWRRRESGLVHGLAFSATLRELHLSGRRLVLSLLGFNLGIELMQLLIVALVLPPLVVLARARHYPVLRTAAAAVAGIAALGWLADRTGLPNPIADAADDLQSVSEPIVIVLWALALLVACANCGRFRRKSRREGPPGRAVRRDRRAESGLLVARDERSQDVAAVGQR